MDFRDRSDRYATVHVRRWPNGRVSASASGETWNGSKHVPMPPGACKRVAEDVLSLLRGTHPEYTDNVGIINIGSG